MANPQLSLKHEYEMYVEQEIENYKDSIPRSAILRIGDEAVSALQSAEQTGFDEMLLCTEVDRIIRAVAEREILPRFGRLTGADISEKAPGDLVTVADRAAEEALTAALEAAVPGSVAVGEEAVAGDRGLLAEIAGERPVWIIDPIDGTHNFAAENPRFTTLVALAHRGRLVASWTYAPVLDLMAPEPPDDIEPIGPGHPLAGLVHLGEGCDVRPVLSTMAARADGRPPVIQMWARPRGVAPDALFALMCGDLSAPVTFAVDRTGWAPTIQLTAFLRGLPADGWLRIIATCTGS